MLTTANPQLQHKFSIVPHFLTNMDSPRNIFFSCKPLDSFYDGLPSRTSTLATVFSSWYVNYLMNYLIKYNNIYLKVTSNG